MSSPSSGTFRETDGLPARAASVGPLLALVLVGVLADVAPPEEAYAGIGYGLSLLAFLGVAGGAVCLTSRLHSRPEPLPGTSPVVPGAGAFAPVPGPSARGEGWPLLVALLFGPPVVLISGLGGWV